MTQLPSHRLSKTSFCSLIFGILGCVPFVAGALAILFGIVGMMRTRNPLKSGRWMAVVGLVLGVVSIFVWSGIGVMGGGVYAIFKATAGPRIAAHGFLHDVAAGDDAGAKADTAGMSDDDYQSLARQIRDQGSFVDTTFTSTNISNDSAHVSGTAEFEKGGAHTTAGIGADLQNVGGHWRVKSMTVSP